MNTNNRKFLDECDLSREAADKYFEAMKNLKPKYYYETLLKAIKADFRRI